MIVEAFNALPRSQTTPTGLPNHWVFCVRHVPLNPPGDLLYVVHPESCYNLTAGPGQIIDLPTVEEKSKAIVPLLLQAFVKMGQPPPGMPTDTESRAPWSWATKNQGLAKAIERQLTTSGVNAALCKVGATTAEQDAIVDEDWSRLVGMLMKTMCRDAKTKKAATESEMATLSLHDEDNGMDGDHTPACARCQKHASGNINLKSCGGCRKAQYCSKDCQRAHWRTHKKVCRQPDAPESSSIDDAIQYFIEVAHTKPEAQSLAKSVNLVIPTSTSSFRGLLHPVRRLVVTGKDTPEDLQLLFGPTCKDSIASTVEQARMSVLLKSPRGSPDYTIQAPLDKGAPRFSPRPASTQEQAKIDQVKAMQRRVRERLGGRKQPNGSDMQAILTSFGAEWVEQLPLYTLAINSMDQGVKPQPE